MTPLEGLQATLAAEHAAVYLYGALGGRTSISAEPVLADRLRATYTVHRDRRDALTLMVRQAGGVPVASQVAYVIPGPIRTPGQVAATALTVERRCASTYADLAGSTTEASRSWALDALADAALRELDFGAEPQDYPGLPER